MGAEDANATATETQRASPEPRRPTPLPARAPRQRVLAQLRVLRLGVVLIFGLRLVLATLGMGALFFAAAALVTGPVAPAPLAVLAWIVVGGGALGAAAFAAWPARRYAGDGVTRLFGSVAPPLVSATRSVMELANDRRAGSELVEAHARRVADSLEGIRAHRLWPWGALRGWTVGLAVVALGAAALVLATVDRARTGAYALTHPGAREEGTQVASVVGTTRARLHFPAYMGLEDEERAGIERLEAPVGTAVQVTFRPRIALGSATLAAPQQSARFEATGDGWWQADFVLRESGSLVIDVVDGNGSALRDAHRRQVVAVADEAPEVQVVAPPEDEPLALALPLAFAYDASDAIGVVQIDLCVRTPGGSVERRTLDTFPSPVLRHHGRTRVAPVELSARPGDRLTFWFEAFDSDDVSGPNVGRSDERTYVVESDATRRDALAADLRTVLDAGLHTLADRLEGPVPAEADASRQRDEALAESTQRYLAGLEALGASEAESFDPSVLRSMERRVEKARAREHRLVASTQAEREAADADLVSLLEEQSLFLSDLLGRTKLQDAAALARELEQLRREMRSLLSELRRTDSPQAREALMAALARARARLAELEGRLASMGDAVPNEFLNTDSLGTPQAKDSLSDLRSALEAGDLDAAERALTALEQQIDSLAKSLGAAGESFAESRFGPRQRAMAEALDRLVGLEAEQRQLAERTEDVRRDAAERALGAAGAEARQAARAVAQRAREAGDALGQLSREVLSPSDEENLDRARQRLRDTSAALDSGDLAEARRMAGEAESDTERLARDLEVSALMFSGRDGRVAQAAQRARQASRSVRGLGRALDEALPRIADFVEGEQGRQMEGDSERQGRARTVAGSIGESFTAEPDGAPLSPEGAEVMERVGAAMQDARESLRRGDPLGASRSQREAARDLTELREKLEQQSRSQSGEGGGEGGSSQPAMHRRVSIPEAEDDAEAERRRRQILDAMQGRAPEGFEDAIRRYYEELLR